MKHLYFTALLLLGLSAAVFSAVCAQLKMPALASYLPCREELGGWFLADSIRTYAGEELFTLIDGGADLFFEYGFRQVVAAEYRNDRDQSIKLELYEMSDDDAAFGRYSLASDNHGTIVHIGNEGFLNEYYLVFWQNRFLVFLSAGDTARETSDEILSIAAILEGNLGSRGKEPALLSYLPGEGLATRKYVRGDIGLMSVCTFDTKNIFGMENGVVGKYPSHTVFIFGYASAGEAGENFENAEKTLSGGKRFPGFEISAGRWTATDPKGFRICATQFRNLIVIIAADQKSDASAISSRVVSFIKSVDIRNE
jgi:hypothetical protein